MGEKTCLTHAVDILFSMKKFLAVLFLFIIILSASTLMAEDKICKECGQEITKLFVKANGYYFHPSHFKCYYCKKVIEESKYYFEDDKFYHQRCYEKIHTLPCAYCGKNINGHYVQYDNKNYHRECYQLIAIKCDYCRLRIKDNYVELDGKIYHPECYADYIALKCDLCGEIISGSYLLDIWGNKYHAEHEKEYPRCDYCQAIFAEGGIVTADGRNICARCNETAVNDMSVLKGLAKEINYRLMALELDVPFDDIDFYLVDRDKLRNMYQSSETHRLSGFTYCRLETALFGLYKANSLKVYILKGMPRMWTIETVAHELNHVWQFLANPKEKDLAFSEGSANYASYLILQSYNEEIAEHLITSLFEDENKIYGDGFRRVNSFVEASGLDYWRQYLADNLALPEGY